MSSHQLTASYDEFVGRAAADPAVVGLVLKGSQAHEGMPTAHSDHDLYVVLADDATTGLARFAGYRTPELDLVPLPGWDTPALLDARGEDLHLMRPC